MKPPVQNFRQLLLRFKARSYYRRTRTRRLELISASKRRRLSARWASWLLDELRQEWAGS